MIILFFFSTFYLIDISRPVCVVHNIPAPETSFSAYADALPPSVLNPLSSQTRLKLFPKHSKSAPVGFYNLMFQPEQIYVFEWDTSISACKDALKYYHQVVFMEKDIIILESDQQQRFFYFDQMPSTTVPTDVLDTIRDRRSRLHRKINLCSSLIDVKKLLEEEQECQKTIFGIHIFVVSLHENQISDLFAMYIQKEFSEFKVVRESQSSNRFLLFFDSRQYFSIVRKSVTNISSAAAVFFCEDTSALTLEAKNTDTELKDKYQMLANMEIAASEIASRQLNLMHRIEKINVVGALLNYKLKIGTIYKLTLDFKSTPSSSCVHQSQEIKSISSVMKCVFNYI